MARCYLDTSALMRWVERNIAAPSARDVHGGAQVDALIGDGATEIGICELTLLEVRSSISRDLRMADADHASFDETWAVDSNLRVMQEVASGRFEVLSTPSRAGEHAATLLDLATVEHGVALGIWDAIHLITASAWAHAKGTRVQLYTCDDGFERFVGLYPEFDLFVEVIGMNP